MPPTSYIHQPYPTMYHHPDGREIKIKSDEHLASVLATDDRWLSGSRPFQPPVAKPKPLTAHEIESMLSTHAAQIDILVKTNEILTKANSDLNEAVTELTVQIEEVAQHPRIRKLLD